MATVVLLGTLDTKGREYDYLRDRLREQGVDVVLVDAGVFEPLVEADVTQRRGCRRCRRRPRGAARGAATAAPPSRRWAAGRRRSCAACTRRAGSTASSRVGGSGNSSIGAAGDAGAAGRRAEADRLDRRLRRHAAVRRRHRRLDDLLRRRHLRAEPDLGADPLERGRRDRRDGEGRASRESEGEPPADRRDDVRRDDAGGDAGARAAGGARVRGARLPRDRAPAASRWRHWRAGASSPACST